MSAYHELIWEDGTIDRAAVIRMAKRRARSERDFCICLAACLTPPCYGARHAFVAEHAAKVSPAVIEAMPASQSYNAIYAEALRAVELIAEGLSDAKLRDRRALEAA